MHVKSCPTLVLSDSLRPRDHSLPGSSVHGILKARILEWVAMPSWGSSWPRDQTHISYVPGQAGSLPLVPPEWVQSLSRVQLFATPWSIAHQAPLSMGFSRQEYWSGLPFPSPGDLPNPGIEPRPPTLQADVLTSEPPGKPINNVGRGGLFILFKVFRMMSDTQKMINK